MKPVIVVAGQELDAGRRVDLDVVGVQGPAEQPAQELQEIVGGIGGVAAAVPAGEDRTAIDRRQQFVARRFLDGAVEPVSLLAGGWLEFGPLGRRNVLRDQPRQRAGLRAGGRRQRLALHSEAIVAPELRAAIGLAHPGPRSLADPDVPDHGAVAVGLSDQMGRSRARHVGGHRHHTLIAGNLVGKRGSAF
ncbi:hypothetical protein [Methylobacterium sp. J-090]|uniref:hypothetical protein n=1 Tax=Methylobacterium sp. J-090 TaxID=2836666 RepID=UPI001FBAB956|nr:hypothetical protein [Methylobacterium sp. J-090]MCJ2080960.1 hypothetical protein [Methylobacterium sp. J-090]